MVTKQIRLSSVTDVKAFVNAVSHFGVEVDLIAGRYIVDGKSIMGILSLDLSHPITMNIHTESEGPMLSELSTFIINDTKEAGPQ